MSIGGVIASQIQASSSGALSRTLFVEASATPEPTAQATPTPSSSTFTSALDSLTGATGGTPPARWSSEWWLEMLVGKPLTILAIIATAFVARWVVHRLIGQFVVGMSITKPSRVVFNRGAKTPEPSSLLTERKIQRAETLGQMLRSVATFTIATIASIMVLEVLGFPVAPLLASAGIVGVALGFGAQNLVRDFLSGVFMLIEEQYGVGDVIDMGEAVGAVETVGLRVTSLRDANGTLWYVRNGEVLRVGNKSQGWSNAVIDVSVAVDEDLSRVFVVMSDAATKLVDETEWVDKVMGTPEVLGVEQLTRDAAVIRMTVKTRPGEQWALQRALREVISEAFAREAVRIPPAIAAAGATPNP